MISAIGSVVAVHDMQDEKNTYIQKKKGSKKIFSWVQFSHLILKRNQNEWNSKRNYFGIWTKCVTDDFFFIEIVSKKPGVLIEFYLRSVLYYNASLAREIQSLVFHWLIHTLLQSRVYKGSV